MPIIEDLIITWTLMLTPVVEARGAVPYGLAVGLHPAAVIAIALISALTIFIALRVALVLLYGRFLVRWSWFAKKLETTQRRGEPYIDKYGTPGLVVLAAVPLPMTGIYTSTLLSWTLGISWKTSLLAITIGGVVSSLILTLATCGVVEGLRLLF